MNHIPNDWIKAFAPALGAWLKGEVCAAEPVLVNDTFSPTNHADMKGRTIGSERYGRLLTCTAFNLRLQVPSRSEPLHVIMLGCRSGFIGTSREAGVDTSERSTLLLLRSATGYSGWCARCVSEEVRDKVYFAPFGQIAGDATISPVIGGGA